MDEYQEQQFTELLQNIDDTQVRIEEISTFILQIRREHAHYIVTLLCSFLKQCNEAKCVPLLYTMNHVIQLDPHYQKLFNEVIVDVVQYCIDKSPLSCTPISKLIQVWYRRKIFDVDTLNLLSSIASEKHNLLNVTSKTLRTNSLVLQAIFDRLQRLKEKLMLGSDNGTLQMDTILTEEWEKKCILIEKLMGVQKLMEDKIQQQLGLLNKFQRISALLQHNAEEEFQ